MRSSLTWPSWVSSKLAAARRLGNFDHLQASFQVFDVDFELALLGEHGVELFAGGVQAFFAGRFHVAHADQRGVGGFVALEAVGQIAFDLFDGVIATGEFERIFAAVDLLFERHQVGAVFFLLLVELIDFLVELVDLDLFLGNDLHVLTDFGEDIFDHAAGAFDFEFDRDRLFDGIGDPTGGGADVAMQGAAKDQDGDGGACDGPEQNAAEHSENPPEEK